MAEAPAALRRVLALTGLRFPRGLLGADARALAAAIAAGGAGADALVRVAAAGLWPELRASTEAAVERGARRAVPGDAEAFEIVLAWARSDDPANPLALALALQSASDLAAALGRTELRLEGLAAHLDGPEGRAALIRTAGLVTADLLDLDPDDFEPEIAAYVQADETVEALLALARATGDEEVRAWAREALGAVGSTDHPAAAEALRDLADGLPPEDPAEDPVWVATVQALAEQAIAFALADGGED